MNNNTRDLSEFGMRELAMAGELLVAYAEQGGGDFLTDGVAVEFNPNSGVVFLVDEDFNVGVMEDDRLVQFLNCSVCDAEGTEADLNEQDPEHKEHKIEDGQVIHIGDE